MGLYDVDSSFAYTERLERLRLEDRKHKRETRACVGFGVLLLSAFMTIIFLMADGCSANADRHHEVELLCIKSGRTWEPIHGSCLESDKS